MALKLIGAGLGRTGTLSLKSALEQIGFGPCYHMAEVMAHPEFVALWVNAAKGKPDWNAIFKNYVACVDYPACAFWRELSIAFPDAKVLLSVRDPDKWFDSVSETIFSPMMQKMVGDSPMKEFMDLTVFKEFGNRIGDRAFMVEAFKRHSAEVERTIPKERLLVYEAKQGWEPLCKFLGVPVPDKPFPHVNSREELQQMMGAQGGPGNLDQMRANIEKRMRDLNN